MCCNFELNEKQQNETHVVNKTNERTKKILVSRAVIQLAIDKIEEKTCIPDRSHLGRCSEFAAMDIDPIEVIHVCALKQTNGRQPFLSSLYYLCTNTQVTVEESGSILK